MIQYRLEPELCCDEFIDCLIRSTLSERRPVECRKTMSGMLAQADILVTARTAEGLLVGVARSLSDFHYCTYLSDLAVDVPFQRQGIGRALIEQTHLAAGKHTMLLLLSAPKATSYYPHLGMLPHESAWYFPRS